LQIFTNLPVLFSSPRWKSIEYCLIMCLFILYILKSPGMLRKIFQKLQKQYWFLLFLRYLIWIVFILEIFLFTNFFSSLSLIDAYGILFFDVILTFGFLGFLFLIEAVLSALLVSFIQVAIEKFFSVNPSTIIMGLFMTIIIFEWINLFLTVFNKALF
jgi:hypothetical protein